MQTAPYFDENGTFVRQGTSHDLKKARDYEMPISILKFLARFESSCTLDCCGLSSLEFQTPSIHDARWTMNFRLENELAREREKLAASSAEVLRFRQMSGLIRKDDLIFLYEWLEKVLRQIRSKKSESPENSTQISQF